MLLRASLFSLCLFLTTVFADENWQTQTSQHPTWIKLIKYEISDETESGFVSAIHDPKFFLSDFGRTNPKAELEATISALLNTNAFADDNHPQCRFPARYIWLKDMAKSVYQFPPSIQCPEYDNWRFNGATESISVVFATGYLDNPASFYGHTLLKMNSSKIRKTVNIEDVSINYGAIVPDNENPVSYILKGIFGGYDAGFSHTEYYFHTHNYGENELRDLWEYELALDKPQVDFVLAHAWEVLGKKYTYYFFRKNCSYRMAELLEIIPGLEIIPQNPLFVMPQVLMKKISQATLNDIPLVKNIRRDESRQSKLYRYYRGLSELQKNWVNKIANNINLLESAEFRNLENREQAAIIESLMHYQLYLLKKEPDNIHYPEYYRKVLQKRFQLPAGKVQLPEAHPVPPHQSRPPSRLAIGTVHNTQIGNSVTLHYRPAYYDELDADSAHVSWSSLSMAEIKIRTGSQGTDIQNFDIVSINSFNANATNLPGDSMDTWALKFGLRRQHLACDNCTSSYFEGSLGYGYQLSSDIKLIAEYGAGIQDEKADLGNLYGFLGARLMGIMSPNLTAKAKLRQRAFYDGSSPTDFMAEIAFRYKLGEKQDLRLIFERHEASIVALQYGFYF